MAQDARVLFHNLHLNLGIDRPLLSDKLAIQGLIDSRPFQTPRDVYDRYAALGITHVIFQPNHYPDSTKQEEVLFGAFSDRYRSTWLSFGNLRALPLPKTPPPKEAPYSVLVIGIGGYLDGVYDVTQLSAIEFMPSDLQTHWGQPGNPCAKTPS